MNSLDQRLPRYQQMRDDIAARINRREWRPGDLIPSEAELAAQFGVAIGTVRKAIDGGDKAAAAEVFKKAQSTIDSIADKKIVHKNKAARAKSRLSAAIKAMGA